MSDHWPAPEDVELWHTEAEKTQLMRRIICPHADVSKHRDDGKIREYCNECGATRISPLTRPQY